MIYKYLMTLNKFGTSFITVVAKNSRNSPSHWMIIHMLRLFSGFNR